MGVAWLGTLIRVNAFRPDSWLYRERAWENGGRIYTALFHIGAWKDRLPDGAALFRKGFRKKHILSREPEYLRHFVRETCRAEAVHTTVLLSSLLFFLWNPAWVGALRVLYGVLANTPCILTQRYNRIRLTRLLAARDSVAPLSL
jgi:glycosyl-4,4'-diaponeurosporenoate acyltransferase